MVAQNRYYSSTTRRTTLSADPGTGGGTLTVADSTVFSSLDGKYPYALVISTDGTDREVVYVTNRPTGTTLTVTRGRDGTTGQAHAVGSTVDHMITAADLNELSAHMANDWFNVKDFGATGDGTTNDYAAVQAAIDAVSLTNPGSTLYFPPGTYKIDTGGGTNTFGLELKGACTLYLDRGATIKRGNSVMQYVIQNFNSTYAPTGYAGRGNITITGGGTVDGNAASFTTSCTNIIFAHAENIRVEDITTQNFVDWHGIEFNSVRNGVARGVTIQGHRLVTSGREITEAIQIDLAINSAALPGIGSGAYDNTPCDGILIEGCTVRASSLYGAPGCLTGSHSWADGHQHKNIRVVGCHADGLSNYLVDAANWSNVTVVGNTVVNSNGFVAFKLPGSMTADITGCTIEGNVVDNLGVANQAPAVLAYGINIEGQDDGTIANIGAGKYVRNVTIKGNEFSNVSNTDSAIRALNVLNLNLDGGSAFDVNSPYIARITGCRSARIDDLRAYDFQAGIVVEQGSSATAIGTLLTGISLEKGTGTFVDLQSWGASIKGSYLASQMTSGACFILISGPDNQIQDTMVWKRDGSSTCNGIQVTTAAQRTYLTGVYVKGFGTNTSTAASGVTNTGVWAVSGTAVLDPALASLTTGSINKIVSTN